MTLEIYTTPWNDNHQMFDMISFKKSKVLVLKIYEIKIVYVQWKI